jgi:hypothetical protein
MVVLEKDLSHFNEDAIQDYIRYSKLTDKQAFKIKLWQSYSQGNDISHLNCFIDFFHLLLQAWHAGVLVFRPFGFIYLPNSYALNVCPIRV